MLLEEVIHYYGSTYKFYKLTGGSTSRFADWRKLGYIPIKVQIKLEKLTKGALKANIKHLGDKNGL